MAAYTGTKHSLEAFADGLHMEMLAQDVSVSLIEPGFVKTPFLEKEIALATTHRRDLSDDHRQCYEALINKTIDMRVEFLLSEDNSNGWLYVDYTTDATTAAILDSIQSPYPRTRYRVTGAPGVPAAVVSWMMALVPDPSRRLRFHEPLTIKNHFLNTPF